MVMTILWWIGNNVFQAALGDDQLYRHDGNDTLKGGTLVDILWGSCYTFKSSPVMIMT